MNDSLTDFGTSPLDAVDISDLGIPQPAQERGIDFGVDPLGGGFNPNPGGFETFARRVVGGAAGTVGALAGVGEYLVGSGGVMSNIRERVEQNQQEIFSGLSREQRALSGAEWLPGGEGPSAWEAPFSALAAQVTEAMPSIIISVLPGALIARGMVAAGMGRAAATAGASVASGATAGTLSAGQVWNQISEEIRTAPAEELQQSAIYRDAIASGKSDSEARELLAREAAGLKPLGAAAISGIAGALLEGPLAAGLGTGATGSFLRRLARGAAHEGSEETVESANEEATTQYGLNEGLGREFNIGEIARQGVQGGVVGAVMGGAMGGLSRRSDRPAATVDPAVQAAAGAASPAPTTTPLDVPTRAPQPSSQAAAVDPAVAAAARANSTPEPVAPNVMQPVAQDPTQVQAATQALAQQGMPTPAEPATAAVAQQQQQMPVAPNENTTPVQNPIDAAAQPGQNTPVAGSPAPTGGTPALNAQPTVASQGLPATPLAPEPALQAPPAAVPPQAAESSVTGTTAPPTQGDVLPSGSPRQSGPRTRVGSRDRTAALSGATTAPATDARVKAIQSLAKISRGARTKAVQRLVAEAEKSGTPLPDWLRGAADVVAQNAGRGGNNAEKAARWQAWEDQYATQAETLATQAVQEAETARATQRQAVRDAFVQKAPEAEGRRVESTEARRARLLELDDILTAQFGSKTLEGRLDALGDPKAATPEGGIAYWLDRALRNMERADPSVRRTLDAIEFLMRSDPDAIPDAIQNLRTEQAISAEARRNYGQEADAAPDTEITAQPRQRGRGAEDADFRLDESDGYTAPDLTTEGREAEVLAEDRANAGDSILAEVEAVADTESAEDARRATARRDALEAARQRQLEERRQREERQDEEDDLDPATMSPAERKEWLARIRNAVRAPAREGAPATAQGIVQRIVTTLRDNAFVNRMFTPRKGDAGVQDRALLASLRSKIGDIEIVVLPDREWNSLIGGEATGVFLPNTADEIASGRNAGLVVFPESLLSRSAEARRDTFLHELVHAATVRSIIQGRGPAYQRVESLRQVVDKALPAERSAGVTYAMQNAAEFVAMAMTNAEFQQTLAGITLTDAQARAASVPGTRSAFRAFVEAVRRLLGLGTRATNALEAAMWLGNDALQSTRQMQADARASDRASEFHTPSITSPLERQLNPALEAALDQVSDRLTNISDKLTNVKLGWQTLRQIETAYKDLFSRTQRMNTADTTGSLNPLEVVSRALNTRAQSAEKLVERVFNPVMKQLSDLPTDQRAALSDLLLDSSFFSVRADAALDAKENEHITKSGTPQARQARAKHAELHKRWQSMTPEQKAAYTKVFETTALAHRETVQAAVRNTLTAWWGHQVDQFESGATQALPIPAKDFPALQKRFVEGKESDADRLAVGQAFMDLISTARNRATVDGPYLPHQRRGEYVVRWREATKPVHEFATEQEADAFNERASLPVQGRRKVYYDANGAEITAPDPADLKTARDQHVALLPPNATPEEKATAEREAKRDALKATRAKAAKVTHEVTLQTQGMSFHETKAEAQRFRQELLDSGMQEVKELDLREQPAGLNENLDINTRRILDRMERNQNLGKEARNQLEQGLAEALLTLAPNKMLQSHLIRRRKVLGASRNVPAVLANYATGVANYIAGAEVRPAMLDGIRAMQENIRDGADSAGADSGDTMRRRKVLQEVERRLSQSAFDPYGHGAANPLIRKVQSLSFIYHLASPAYSVIQMLQPYMFTAPMLSARYGTRGVRAISRAMNDIGMGALLKNGGKDAWQAARVLAGVRNERAANNGFLDQVKSELAKLPDGAELNRMLDELDREGLVDASAGLELVRTFRSSEGRLSTKLAQTESLARAFPAAIEVVNRAGTAVATYRLARQAGKSVEAATAEAREVVDTTQADYGASNTARYMSPNFAGGLLAPMMQFRKFSQAVYSLLGRQVYLAVKGKTREEKITAYKTLGYTLAAHSLMAGALGLPTEPITLTLGLAAMAFGAEEPWDWEQDIRNGLTDLLGKDAAEVALRGLPRAIGVDMSSRVGLQGLLFMQDLRDFRAQTMAGYAGSMLLGAPGGMLTNVMQVPSMLQRGEYAKATEAVLPKGLRDIVRAMRLESSGITTRRGERIDAGEGFGAWGAAVQAFGFTPGKVAETYERRDAVQGASRRFNNERGALMRRWRDAPPAQRSAIWREIVEWNQGLTRQYGAEANRARLTMQALQASLRETERRRAASGQRDYLPRNQEFLRREGRFAND